MNLIFALVALVTAGSAVPALAYAPTTLMIPTMVTSLDKRSAMTAGVAAESKSDSLGKSVLKLTPVGISGAEADLHRKARLMSATLRIAEKCGLAPNDLDLAAEALGSEIANLAETINADRLALGKIVTDAAAEVDRDFPGSPPAATCERAVKGLESSL